MNTCSAIALNLVEGWFDAKGATTELRNCKLACGSAAKVGIACLAGFEFGFSKTFSKVFSSPVVDLTEYANQSKATFFNTISSLFKQFATEENTSTDKFEMAAFDRGPDLENNNFEEASGLIELEELMNNFEEFEIEEDVHGKSRVESLDKRIKKTVNNPAVSNTIKSGIYNAKEAFSMLLFRFAHVIISESKSTPITCP